jgi:hypothetical protein
MGDATQISFRFRTRIEGIAAFAGSQTTPEPGVHECDPNHDIARYPGFAAMIHIFVDEPGYLTQSEPSPWKHARRTGCEINACLNGNQTAL